MIIFWILDVKIKDYDDSIVNAKFEQKPLGAIITKWIGFYKNFNGNLAMQCLWSVFILTATRINTIQISRTKISQNDYKM